MEQKPSIGRIVIFVYPEGEEHLKKNNRAVEAPAIVTRVWDAEVGMVNLKVQNDGSENTWAPSVKYSEEPVPYSWHWPARV